MDPERRRSPRIAVAVDGLNGVVKGAVPVALHDISAGGLRLGLRASLEPGGVYPLTALLRGLSLTTPIRITRCSRGGPAWEAGAEFLWRDDGDAAAVRRWLRSRASGTF